MSERLGFEKHYNVEIAGIISRLIFHSVPMSTAEAQTYWEQDTAVPLDIMPRTFWWNDDLPRFGEEALGAEF